MMATIAAEDHIRSGQVTVACLVLSVHAKIIEEPHFERAGTHKMRTHPEFPDRFQGDYR